MKAFCSEASQNLGCGKDLFINVVLVTPETTLISKIERFTLTQATIVVVFDTKPYLPLLPLALKLTSECPLVITFLGHLS